MIKSTIRISNIVKYRFLFFFLFSISFYISNGQSGSNYNRNQDTTITMDGEIQVMTVLLNGKTIKVTRSLNGKKEGVEEVYRPDGRIISKATYQNGYLDGVFLRFDYSGNIYELLNYKYNKSKGHSLLQGKYEKYNRKDLQIEVSYKDSLKQGVENIYQNNKLIQSTTFKNGLKVGKAEVYSRGQEVLLSKVYYKIIEKDNQKQSVLHGKATYYTNRGDLLSEGVYNNGLKVGLWRNYDRGVGTLISEINYKEGTPNGKFTRYYQNGNLSKRGIQYTVNNGSVHYVFDGMFEEFYSEGALSQITNYDMGKRSGSFQSYHKSGVIKQKGDYVNNLKTGEWVYFDSDGDTISIISFKIVKKNGADISVKQGVEKHWKNKMLISKVNFRDGLAQATSYSYYENGQLSRKANYVDGLLVGEFIDYYENGQMKVHRNYKIINPGTDYEKSKLVGWDIRYQKDGRIQMKLFTDSLANIISIINYGEKEVKSIEYRKIVKVAYFPDGQPMSIAFSNIIYPMFSQRYYRNGYTRAIGFQNVNKHIINNTILSSDGRILFSNSTGHRNPDSLLPDSQTVSNYFNAVGTRFIQNNFYTDSIRNGKYVLRYANGNIMCKMEFKDDVPDGDFVLYDALIGDTIMFRIYKQGMQTGYYLERFAGKIPNKRGALYPNGKNKWSESYYLNGTKKSHYTHDESGKRTTTAEYWEDGKLRSISNSYDGSSASYDRQGNVSTQTIVKDSIRVYRNYFPNSKQLRTVNYYLNGQKDRIWETFFESGQMWYSYQYKKGKLNGEYIQYYPEGNPKFVGNYKDDIKVGKWLFYNENQTIDTITYKNGKIVVKIPSIKCGCVDTTISKLGNAYPLSNLFDYQDFEHLYPDNVKGIDSNMYSDIFYQNFYSNHGSYSLKLIVFDYLSIGIPADEQIKVTLNPCKTPGFISSIPASAYASSESARRSLTLNPKRILMEFMKGPLESADSNYKRFTALYDMKSIYFNTDQNLEFNYAMDPNSCFSLGVIKDFLYVDVINANPKLFESLSFNALKLSKEELSYFFGLEITSASLTFKYQLKGKLYKIKANSNYILAGGRFLSAIIQIPCTLLTDNECQLGEDNSNIKINIDHLRKQWFQKGFKRLKINYNDHLKVLELNFFIE